MGVAAAFARDAADRAERLALALRNRRRRDSCALGRTLRGKSEGLA